MKRRKLLLSVGAVTSSFPGCLGSRNTDTDNNTEYERCALTYVPFIDLPTPAKEEVSTAIENDGFVTDGELVLSEVIDIDESYITDHEENGWIYYDMTAITDDSVIRLHADETHPKKTDLPTVENGMGTEVTIDIRIEYEGDPVFEDRMSLAAGEVLGDIEDRHYNQDDYRYGQYQGIFKIKTKEGIRVEEVSWTQNHIRYTKRIVITPNELKPLTMWGARSECKWNDEGELVSGPEK